ncbi:MAG: hypothetical protein K5896_01210 [Prevotella sp.]|nr:hypothetical protein [Prevotella sp.]
MSNTNIAPQQGNLFETENIVVNPAAAETPQPAHVEPAAETPPPVFAVTKGNIGTAVPQTGEQITVALADPELHAIRDAIRAETDEAKQKALKEEKKYSIIGLCPHYWQFNNNHRAAAEALPECCTHKTCVDMDKREYGQQAIEGALRLTKEPGVWKDKVIYIENSLRGSGKCHIWLICPVGMTAIETQEAFCKALGIPCDDSVQMKQSFIYMTGDAVYQTDDFLRPLSQEQIEARQTAFRLRGLSIDGWEETQQTHPHPVGRGGDTPKAGNSGVQCNCPPPYKGGAGGESVGSPTPRTDYIFDRHYKMTGLDPQLICTPGHQHNTVKSLLSTGIVAMLTKAEMAAQLLKRTPDYWNDPDGDCRRLVDDFYSKYNDPARALTREQRQIMAVSERMNETSATAPDEKPAPQPYCDELNLSEIYASPEPPRLNRKKTPRVVKAVISRTPDENVECVSQTSFPALQAHPVGLSAKYIDNRPRELRGGCVAVAETGIGKACVDLPIKHIMADVEATTAAERKAEQDFHQEVNTRNSNLDKPRRRKFKIRNLMANLTSAALILRTADNDGAPLYCKMNEIEQWNAVENASGSKNSFTIMKLNDDEGNQYGAERAGTQSVTASTSLFLNWNASTTPSKLIRYLRHVVTDGPISRLTLATIPDPGIGADCPVFGDYDDGKYDAALKPFIDNLNAATGMIDCPQARKMIKELKAECDEFAIGSGDRVFDNLTHRALVHVFRKAICIFVANGMKWEANIKPFCRWSLHYDLWLKLHYFGDLIRQANADVPTSKRGPQNMMELMTDPFTFQQLSDKRFSLGMDREGTANQIYQWLHRKKILRLTADSFKKA